VLVDGEVLEATHDNDLAKIKDEMAAGTLPLKVKQGLGLRRTIESFPVNLIREVSVLGVIGNGRWKRPK
jgi:hypothetical protein